MRLTRRPLVLLAIAGIGILGVSLRAQGQKPSEGTVLSALLVEVRGLRAAMEQMAAAGPRVQLALGRLQLQEQRVNTMLRRLETLRDSIHEAGEELSENQSQLASMEGMFRAKGIPEGNPLTEMIAGLKSTVSAASATVQRLRAEEALVEQQLADEQARWTQINRALEDLERSLGTR